MQQDFSQKIVLVIRNDLESWQTANVIAHISAFLGNTLRTKFSTGDSFHSADNVHYPQSSQYPIIIKRAKSNQQLQNLFAKANDTDVEFHAFIKEMIDFNNDERLQQHLSKINHADIKIYGIGIFGQNETVNALTKKFGLWK